MSEERRIVEQRKKIELLPEEKRARERFLKIRKHIGPVLRAIRAGAKVDEEELVKRLLSFKPLVWGVIDESLIEEVEQGKWTLTFFELLTFCQAFGISVDAVLDAAELEASNS